MNREGIVRQITELAIPLLASEQLELIDVEFKREGHGQVLRFLIDREGGVDLDTCTKTSEILGDMLEMEDIVTSSYNLEVCSPGIERPLKRPEDFSKFVGSKIYAKTRTKTHDRKHFAGILGAATKETFTVKCDDITVEIPYKLVSKAHLVVDLDF